MNKAILLSFSVMASVLLIACGGGSSNSGLSTNEPVEVSGAGVKGPLAGAVVNVYAIDYASADFRGAQIGAGSTGPDARITGLSIPGNTSGKLFVEFNVDQDTVDITTNTAPSFSQLVTVVDASRLLNGDNVYASLLTTMATELAMLKADSGAPYLGNNDSTVTEQEFTAALDVAQGQVKSTLGFGLDNTVDVFVVPPLITSETQTVEQQTHVAAYRQANEALSAIVTKVSDESVSQDSPEEILDALVEDLTDGNIDGRDEDGDVAVLVALDVAIDTTLVTTDPTTLMIPGTNTLVSDVEDILVSEKTTTGSNTDTTNLEDGTVEVEPEVAAVVADADQDGVEDSLDEFPNDPTESVDRDGDGVGDNSDVFPDNALEWSDTDGDQVGDNSDAFPEDPNETVDTDEDGVGDNGDVFPNDPAEWADTDGDQVGDNADVFPLDASESEDTDSDGVGDNADVFPNNPLETADSDGDGVGDNSDAYPDDPTRSVADSVEVAMWIGAEDTQVSFQENLNGVDYIRSTKFYCDIFNYSLCENGQMDVINGSPITDTATQIDREGYHQFVTSQSSSQLDVGINRWIKRTHTAVLTFNDRMWVVAGNDGINDSVSDPSNPNGSPENFDGYLAKDVWSSQDGNTWVKVTDNAAFGVRQNHSMIEFQGKMWLIGGNTYNQPTQNYDVLNDVWSSIDGLNWTQVTSSAPFSVRINPALVVFDEKLWIIGGQGDDYIGKSDVWNTENGTDWVLATEDTGFRGQDYPNIVKFNNKLWLVGGSGMYDEVWSSSNGVDWVEEVNTNYSELTRNVSSVTVHDNKIWVVGGFDNDSYNNEVWVSVDGLTYVEVPKAEGHYFSDRVEVGLLSFDDRLWIIGGRRSSGYEDVLSSTDGAAWYRHSFGPAELTQRHEHSFVGFNGKLFSFAGSTYQPDSSIWSSANGLSWQQESNTSPFQKRYGHETAVFNNKLWVVGGMDRLSLAPSSTQNDVWSSNDGVVWTQEIADAGFEARRGHRIVEWNNKLWMVAGFSGLLNGEKNDVWSSVDGVNWTLENDTAAFPARYGHGLVVFANRLWVIGGINTSTFEYYTDVWSSSDGINWTQETDDVPAMFKPNDTGTRTGFVTYSFSNKIMLMGGRDSAGYLSDIWSTADGINWALEKSDSGMSGRTESRVTTLNGELYLQGGGYQDGIAFFEKDVWKSDDGVNWRAGLKATVSLQNNP